MLFLHYFFCFVIFLFAFRYIWEGIRIENSLSLIHVLLIFPKCRIPWRLSFYRFCLDLWKINKFFDSLVRIWCILLRGFRHSSNERFYTRQTETQVFWRSQHHFVLFVFLISFFLCLVVERRRGGCYRRLWFSNWFWLVGVWEALFWFTSSYIALVMPHQ